MAETNVSTTKKCSKCKSVLPLTSFNKNKSKWDGLGTECRTCANAHSKKYHATHLDEHKVRTKVYKAANPEKFKQWNKQQYERQDRAKELARKNSDRAANPEKWREYSRKSWAKNAEKCRARKKLYRQNFPALALHFKRLRQTRLRNALPAWANMDAIKAIYRQCAWVSKITGVKHHVDHYFPLTSNVVCGLHVEQNLRIIPATLNQSKGNSFPEE